MKVFMKKDVPQVGKAGTVLTIPDGYARNYLLPHNLAIEITEKNEASIKQALQKNISSKEAFVAKLSLMAEKIKSLHLVLKRKLHDDGKLYGAVNAHEVVELLAQHDIVVKKNQIIFKKPIKTKGLHSITVELTGQLKSEFTLEIINE